ncbi:nitroreductase family deazaflavin-dependent oxidoreductase [Kineobactrum sediminis]|uniref:Nitroreductase family deazaflavin-dependent oxidoreductase n=1 Tax=Kineobactrum sediminis TaxID=1905677 RepID=A0A2N5Y486_9GAMM|nr:nitroreductase/quinone reductase family protein [Kineobactrum sediminis]PLW83215.1 nitroreductase family deazaflavin-dependent oxidoreductase [Kineobactrum sediminis]
MNYKTFSKFHTWVYRASGGLIMGSVGAGRRVLLLNARGRKSGALRTTPLVYMADGERFVVYGSNSGSETPPAWLLNLQANPHAEVEGGKKHIPVKMHIARGEEEARLMPLAHAYNAHWAGYHATAKRHIPLVVLTPEQSDAAAMS